MPISQRPNQQFALQTTTMTPSDQKPEAPRRRIVVPLGQTRQRKKRVAPGRASPRQPKPSQSGRAGKVIAILAMIVGALLLVVAAGVLLWWQHYKTTPAYSLALLVEAAQHNDMPGVDQIVDTDKIVDSLADQVIDKAAGRYGGALSADANKAIRARGLTLLPNIKQQVRSAIAIRVKEISAKADQKPFLLIAVGLPYFVKITTIGGEIADARVTIRDQEVQLGLTRSAGLWRVVSVKDDALIQRLVDEVIRNLPAISPNLESDIRKNLKKPRAPVRLP